MLNFNNSLINKRVRIKNTNNKRGYQKTLNMLGTIHTASYSDFDNNISVGVKLDYFDNNKSRIGVYWYRILDVELLENNMGENI